jgi:hypothetical protein
VSKRSVESTLEQLYPTLSPRERLRASLLAVARQDFAQVDRLARSCPKKTYTQRDAAFTDALEGSHHTTMRFVALWMQAAWMYDLNRLRHRLYETARESLAWGFVLGANGAWADAGQEGAYLDVDGRAPTRDEAIELGLGIVDDVTGGAPNAGELAAELRALEDERRAVLREMKGVRAGLQRFCARVDLEPEQVLAWFPPILDMVARMAPALEDEAVPLDEETVASAAIAFSEGWPDALLKDEGAETR